MGKRERPGRRRLNSGKILLKIGIGMAVLVALSSALTIYFKQEQQIARIEQRQLELSRQLAEAAADYAALQELQQLAGSDAYIEKVARDQLGMVRPGELVFQDE